MKKVINNSKKELAKELVSLKAERKDLEPCYESYQQYGASTSVLSFTLPIAERLVRSNFKTL